MFNGLAINPAYAGSHEALSATFLSRFQNVGLPGSPNTQTLSLHSPLLNKRVALGLLVIHDHISVVDQTGIHFSYAYRLPVTSKGTLSMGLQGGMSFYRADYSHLDIYNPSDPVFGNDIREARPNIGAGLYYYTRLAYVGVSMPHLINNVLTGELSFKQSIKTSRLSLREVMCLRLIECSSSSPMRCLNSLTTDLLNLISTPTSYLMK